MKTILLRVDDIGVDDGSTLSMLDCLLSQGFPLTCAVIPHDLGQDTSNFIRRWLAQKGDLLHVAQHGWAHCNHAAPGERRNEFAISRSPSLQQRDIAVGKARLEDALSQPCHTFSPPYDRLSPTTLDVLASLGFNRCLGGAMTFQALKPPAALATFAFQHDASVRVDGRRIMRPIADIEGGLCADHDAVVGLILHRHEMEDEANVPALIGALTRLRAQGHRFSTVDAIKVGSTP